MIKAVISSFKQSITGKDHDEREKIADEHILVFEEEIVTLATNFKHPSFSEEEEWRLVYNGGINSFSKKIKFRASVNGIIPYVEYDSCSEKNNMQLLPIVEVWLGPTVRQEAALKSIEMITYSLYPGLYVRGSIIPFR